MKKNSGKSKRAATAKRKADSPAMYGSALDSYHYHEAMDRISVILQTFENSVCEHEVTQKHVGLRRLCRSAAGSLIKCYQEAARLSNEKSSESAGQKTES